MPRPAPDMPAIEKGKYIHSKSGKEYEVVGVAMHSETLEPLVLYKPMYAAKYEFCVRPYQMFVEEVTIDGKQVPRFAKVANGD